MIQRLMQIRTGRDAVLAALTITVAAVALAVGMTALATCLGPVESMWHAALVAAWVSVVIGGLFSYWFVASFRAIARLKDTVDRLARTDDLTGLDNRRAFLAGAERELSRGGVGDALALLILDLDFFKRINDDHGHRVGDLVLVAVADVLARAARAEGGLVGRLGGEEFAVLLPRCDEEAARRIAEDLRAAVEAKGVATPIGEIVTTVSVGCAAVAVGDSVSAALQQADEALYAAKRGGRNRVALHSRGSAGPAVCERHDRQRRNSGPASIRRTA